MIEIEISVSEILALSEPPIDQSQSEMMRFSGFILECDEICRSRGVVEEYCSCKYLSVDRSCVDADIRTMIFREILLSPDIVSLPFMPDLRLLIGFEEVFERGLGVYSDPS
jgi:hypothetical protein